jgi:hypothetical protein
MLRIYISRHDFGRIEKCVNLDRNYLAGTNPFLLFTGKILKSVLYL